RGPGPASTSACRNCSPTTRSAASRRPSVPVNPGATWTHRPSSRRPSGWHTTRRYPRTTRTPTGRSRCPTCPCSTACYPTAPKETMPMSEATPLLLKANLKQLKLPTVLAEYEKLAREAAERDEPCDGYLLRLTELEVAARAANALAARIRAAAFPVLKE